MNGNKVTTDELAECLALLKNADRAMTAAEIAARLGLSGCRETQRRRVRAMTLLLRDKGVRVAATRQNGYFITDDDVVWRSYLAIRQIEAKTVLGVTHPRIRQVVESKGQGLLYGQRLTTGAYTGCATRTK